MPRSVVLLALFLLMSATIFNIVHTERQHGRYLAESPTPASIEIATLSSHQPSPTPTSIPTPDTSPTPDASPESEYQIKGVRYWLHPDRARVVFDLEVTDTFSLKPPTYELEDSDEELLVSFPFNAIATMLEPADEVVERVVVPASPGSSTEARIVLNSPVAVHSFHLENPQRVVFDLYPKPTPPRVEPKPTAEANDDTQGQVHPGEWQTLEQELRDRIAIYEAEVGNRIGLAITNLQTKETISINGDERFIPGCAIKLFVWLSILADVQQGKYSLETSIAADSCWYVGGGEWWCGHNRKTIGQYVRDALSVSCNTANSILTRQTGIETVNRRMQEWGMKQSIYSHWYDLEWFKGDHTAYLVYSKAELENYLVPEEVNTVLGKLYQGELFPPEFTQVAIERLTHSSSYLHHNDVIPARLPYNVTVAHKYGFIPPNRFADIGIVITEGFAFAISFFSNGTSSYQAYYDTHDFGAELSRMVFDYFEEKR